jgi:hypothetical protein
MNSPSLAATAEAPQRAKVLFPRWLPRVVGAMLALLLLGVAALRLGGYETAEPVGPAIEARTLRFADTANGEQGFLRGVLRGMARDRRMNEVGPYPPYTLSLHADGRLRLSDPQTGQRYDLASFGPDNAAVFARWLPSNASRGVPKP